MLNQTGKFRRVASSSSKQHQNMYELLAERELPPKDSKPKRSTVTLADSAAVFFQAQRRLVVAPLNLSLP